jgi:DNA-binding response OmpR family regulator
MKEKKILVVDDEVPILDMLKDLFSRRGYQVVTAQSAEKALDILRKESIMVMFLDLKLPGMSGIDLCKRIRKETRLPIIHAFTGHENVFSLLQCRTAGFDDFFSKPANLSILLKAADTAFEKLERWKVDEYGLT